MSRGSLSNLLCLETTDVFNVCQICQENAYSSEPASNLLYEKVFVCVVLKLTSHGMLGIFNPDLELAQCRSLWGCVDVLF